MNGYLLAIKAVFGINGQQEQDYKGNLCKIFVLQLSYHGKTETSETHNTTVKPESVDKNTQPISNYMTVMSFIAVRLINVKPWNNVHSC